MKDDYKTMEESPLVNGIAMLYFGLVSLALVEVLYLWIHLPMEGVGGFVGLPAIVTLLGLLGVTFQMILLALYSIACMCVAIKKK